MSNFFVRIPTTTTCSSLSVGPSVYLSASLFVCLSVYQFVYLRWSVPPQPVGCSLLLLKTILHFHVQGQQLAAVCLSVRPSVYQSVYLWLFVSCLSTCHGFCHATTDTMLVPSLKKTILHVHVQRQLAV